MAGTTTYYGISYPTSTDYVKDGATAMQTIATGFDSAVAIPTYNNQTGTSYTFVLADAGKTVTSNNASAVTFTIPPQTSVAWANNTTLTVRNLGAGVVTIAGGAGVTVTNTAQTVAQYGEVKLIRTASNAWTVVPASGGVSALTLITSNSFSASSAVNLNNVFSSTYQNYFAVYNITSASQTSINVRLRASGTDDSNNSYLVGGFYVGLANSSAFSSANNNTSTFFGLYTANSTVGAFGTFQFVAPQQTEYTKIISNGGGFDAGVIHGVFNATTAFDGFTIYPSSGTITGNIRIYGYQNS